MDLDLIWKNTIDELKVILAPAVYQTFVASTHLVSFKDNHLVIGCRSSYLAEINQKRYYPLFKSALDNQTKVDTQIEFVVQELPSTTKNTDAGPLFTPPPQIKTISTHLQRSGLHPKYTFQNLIVGNSNNFAFAAAQGIVKNPGLLYNPFFIWGGVGVGKTHLMQAVGHELLNQNPDLKIKYFPAETFGNELINSLKTKSIASFKEKYRQLDCILVDDIQFIAGKEYIQEEFFHTFNTLHLNGKQIILTSDRRPSDIQNLEDRLVSRFMGGLTVDIQLPDFEMRSAIIRQKAEEKGIAIEDEAVSHLAENVSSNIRDLEGKLQALNVQAHASNLNHITLEIVQSFLSGSHDLTAAIGSLKAEKINPRHIISVCAKHFNIKTGDLTGPSRKKDLVSARHVTAYLLLTEGNLALEEVGRLLGGRDHTSVMHARDKVNEDLSTNPQTRQLINTIKGLF